MTTEQVARIFNAKRIGKGKWMALCPAHPDRNRSLAITEGKRWVLLRCWSQNCATEDILKAAGLTMEQLAYDSGRKLDRKARAALAKAQAEREKEQIEEERSRYRHQFFTMRRDGYTVEDMAKDWEVCIAMAERMAVEGPTRFTEWALEWHGHRVTIGSTMFKLNLWRK